MGTLKDYKFAMTGEATTENQKAIQTAENEIIDEIRKTGKGITTSGEWIKFKLVNSNRKGGVHLPYIDDVINPETGNVERMRLLSGVSTVWMKEQKEITPEYARNNSRTIAFPRGQKVINISKNDKAALTFMRLTNSNIGSPSKTQGSRFEFYEFDADQMEKSAFEKESFALDMAIEAKQAEVGYMKKHAHFLGISLMNEFGDKKADDGVRREYVMYAKKNPDYFKQTMKTKEVEISYMVRSAISDSKIEIGREPGRAFWAKNGGAICAYPIGSDPSKHLIDLALTNSPEGKEFLDQLQHLNK